MERRQSHPRRKLALALSVCALAGASATQASAAEVSAPASSGLTMFIGGPEGNDVAVSHAGSNVIFVEAGGTPLTHGFGGGCSINVAGDTATCPNMGFVAVSTGDGDDTIHGASGSNHQLNGGAGDDEIHGGAGDDGRFTGNGSSNFGGLEGGDGNDKLYAGSGDDLLNGGAGNDEVYGEAGNDAVNGGVGIDLVDGGTGDDDLNQTDGLSGPFPVDGDTFEGGAGNDTVDYSIRFTPVTVTADGIAPNDGVAGENDNVLGTVENVFGGSDHDTLTGSGVANELYGGAGDDTLSGAAGSDGLFGGAGNDILTGGADRDELRGERGDDDIRSKDFGRDQIGCGAGVDSLVQDDVDTVDGDCELLTYFAAPGDTGATGANGEPGVATTGAPGPAGARGPAGPSAHFTVKCKLAGKRKNKVACTTKSAAASARGARVLIRLSRGGRVVGSGSGRLRNGASIVDLRLRGRVQAGRYTLTARVPLGSGKTRTIRRQIVIA